MVGYLPNYRGPLSDWTNTLDFSALTHVNLAFASVDNEADGIAIHYRQKDTPSGDDPGLADFVKKAHGSGSDGGSGSGSGSGTGTGTKVCLSVAGG
ncbi:MAG TPA: hypothetical protein VHM25_10340, partial [Polyangiaceae bacterium]|nr:hypothetical protein [Polyangiaceae bacterium]